MFKEFLREKLIGLLHLGRIKELELKINELEEFMAKADATNQRGIEFILDRIEVDDKYFDQYKWEPFNKLPWYVKRIFSNKYHLTYATYQWRIDGYIYCDGDTIGYGNDPIAKILESLKEYKKRPKIKVRSNELSNQ